jgi:hypothetical protein
MLVKDRLLLVPLVMLNACLTFSWLNKVPFEREASGIIWARIYTGARTGAKWGLKSFVVSWSTGLYGLKFAKLSA